MKEYNPICAETRTGALNGSLAKSIPNIKNGSITYTISLDRITAEYSLKCSSPNGAFKPVTIDVPADTEEVEATVKVIEPELWSPESPTLYPIVLELINTEGLVDRLESYFGLREVSVGPAAGRNYQYIYLNGKPIYPYRSYTIW